MTTTVDNESLENAVRLVLNTARGDDVWTLETIETKVRAVMVLLKATTPEGAPLPDEAEVIRQVEARVNVTQPPATSLVDSRGHEPWLADARTTVRWNFWDRYRRYLEDVELLPRAVVRRLDDVTDGTLGKLESPLREGDWDRRGLVVGQVQSGKTSNYTGLICKAADAGYKLILVLAGIHNSLRSQTQLRLDEGFLGMDTQYLQRNDQGSNQHRIGVGAMLGTEWLGAASLTTSAENGDFRDAKARSLALPIGDYPVVLVVKKHAGILANIHDWVTTMHGTKDSDGRTVVREIPLLVIDDEADNASVNTGKLTRTETDPTSVNRNLRRILRSFARSAYVGYTATPYANLYIDAYGEHSEFGEDVFPRSFIDVLRPPTNYFGPERVFGLDDDSGGATAPPLPISRVVDDQSTWMPEKHPKAWDPTSLPLPESLRTALRSFVLTCAARRARGDITKHNSMLVHVSRFQDVQARVARQIKEELSILQNRLRYGDGERDSRLVDELEQLWVDDFVPTTAQFAEAEAPLVPWEAVDAQLLAAVSKIELRVMNGQAKDALEYYERRREGLSVVAIGGNKLSRGLTLEGLSVSYYLRASLMYDTLLQMGRWFGYRPRYEDLCRLYTTRDLYSWYREITQASDELREMLEEMAAQRANPEEFGLRVRTSAAGLSITAANKMRRAQRVRLSFSGGIPETIVFDIRTPALEANRAALNDLCSRLGDSERSENENHLWTSVDAQDVLRFLEQYKGDAQAVRARPDLIAGYIRECQRHSELRSWDVMLIDNQTRQNGTGKVAGRDIGLTLRSLLSEHLTDEEEIQQVRDERRYVIRRLLNPADEWQNLNKVQREAALQATVDAYHKDRGRRKNVPTVPGGPQLRRQRRDDQPLLVLYLLDNSKHSAVVAEPMVGFAISFPFSAHNVTAEYAVNEVWQKLQLADLEADVDDPDDDD